MNVVGSVLMLSACKVDDYVDTVRHDETYGLRALVGYVVM
jgi:hypothetical protein